MCNDTYEESEQDCVSNVHSLLITAPSVACDVDLTCVVSINAVVVVNESVLSVVIIKEIGEAFAVVSGSQNNVNNQKRDHNK